MYDRDSQTLRRDEEQLRQSAVAKADESTEGQAARLDTTPEEILEAVRRGWLPEQIEGVTSKYALEGHPLLKAQCRDRQSVHSGQIPASFPPSHRKRW